MAPSSCFTLDTSNPKKQPATMRIAGGYLHQQPRWIAGEYIRYCLYNQPFLRKVYHTGSDDSSDRIKKRPREEQRDGCTQARGRSDVPCVNHFKPRTYKPAICVPRFRFVCVDSPPQISQSWQTKKELDVAVTQIKERIDGETIGRLRQ